MDTKSTLRKIRRFFGVIFSASGLACLVLAAAFALHTKYFLLHAVRASGTIVEMLPVEHKSDGDITVEYAPVFRFQAENGQSYTIRSSTSTNPPEFQTGDAVSVLYDRGDPKEATPDSFAQLWIVPVILVGIAIAHGLIGFVCLYLDRRYRKSLAAPVTAAELL
jgi:hypothetical protein